MKENIPEELGRIIIGKAGPAERFWIELFGIKIPFKIRPVSGQAEIEIATEQEKLTLVNISDETDMFIGMMENSRNIIVFSNMIAIAALSSGWKRFFFQRITARLIRKGTNEDMALLMQIVRKQSNAERFFFTMKLAKELSRLLMKKQKEEIASQVETPTQEQS